MAQPLPEPSQHTDPPPRDHVPARRPRWVTAVIVGAVLVLAVVVVLHLTGNSPGSHLP